MSENNQTTERLTPGQAKRKLCIQCVGTSQFNSALVKDCGGDKAGTGPCPIFKYRIGERMSVKVFRKFCLNCMAGSFDAISECTTIDCPAYEYRFGKNPILAGRIPTAGLAALQKYRENVSILPSDDDISDESDED